MKKLVFIAMVLFSFMASAQYFPNGWISEGKTTTEIQAQGNIEGKFEYNSITKTLWYNNGTSWSDLGTGSSITDEQISTAFLNINPDTDLNGDDELLLAGGTMSGNINMGANAITGMADPTNPSDAATKNYVDANAGDFLADGSVPMTGTLYTRAIIPNADSSYTLGTETNLFNRAYQYRSVWKAPDGEFWMFAPTTASHLGIAKAASSTGAFSSQYIFNLNGPTSGKDLATVEWVLANAGSSVASSITNSTYNFNDQTNVQASLNRIIDAVDGNASYQVGAGTDYLSYYNSSAKAYRRMSFADIFNTFDSDGLNTSDIGVNVQAYSPDLDLVDGTNTGDETETTIKTKLAAGTGLDDAHISDGGISPVKLDADNSPTDDADLTYESSTGNVVYATNRVKSNTTGLSNAVQITNIVAGNEADVSGWAVDASRLDVILDKKLIQEREIYLGAKGVDIETGTSVEIWPVFDAITITEVAAFSGTAPTGSTAIFDINEDGVSMLSTKLSIDATEQWSSTATSTAVISDTTVDANSVISFDIDQVGSTIPGTDVVIKIKYYLN